MRYLTSDIIFTAFSSPINDGVIVVDDEGKIVDLLDNKRQVDSANLEYIKVLFVLDLLTPIVI